MFVCQSIQVWFSFDGPLNMSDQNEIRCTVIAHISMLVSAAVSIIIRMWNLELYKIEIIIMKHYEPKTEHLTPF